MLYKSTHSDIKVSAKQAVFQSQPEDGGLFVPESFPKLDILSLKGSKFPSIAFQVLSPFFEDIPKKDFEKIIEQAFSFPINIKKLEEDFYVLRLDFGPTLAFKDFGVKFLAKIVEYYLEKDQREVTVLTATSGDTGAAVAKAFWGLERVRVVVLFPEKGVSEIQRRQMTTLGKNVKAIAVKGSFDECQSLVKQAFLDKDLRKLNLFSANSINIGRLLPQIAYYFYAAYRILKVRPDKKLVFVVPSGNFGNFVAGVYAYFMDLPAFKIIAAVNRNDVFYKFLETGRYQPLKPSYSTLSNAMDIGNPSNLIRLFYHFGGRLERDGKVVKMPDIEGLKKISAAGRALDEEVLNVIREFYEKYNYLADPHTGVGLKVALDFKNRPEYIDKIFVVLQTAHPAKFRKVIFEKLGVDILLPKALKKLMEKEEKFVSIKASYKGFRKAIQAVV